MTRKNRVILVTALSVCGLVLLLTLSASYVLRTNWVKDKVREKIVSAIEDVSGARVELGSFDYDWRTLSAEFKNLAVRGTEPETGPPLFRADSIGVRLRIVSLLKRQVDITSLNVQR